MFSDLPAIFARNVTEDGLQGEQGVLKRFGASEIGSKPLLPVAQDQRPTGDLLRGWSLLRVCAMIGILHAFLVSDGRLECRWTTLLACHIWTRWARSLALSGEASRDFSREIALFLKCHCSADPIRNHIKHHCRNGLGSPFGIETAFDYSTRPSQDIVGMAWEARSG